MSALTIEERDRALLRALLDHQPLNRITARECGVDDAEFEGRIANLAAQGIEFERGETLVHTGFGGAFRSPEYRLKPTAEPRARELLEEAGVAYLTQPAVKVLAEAQRHFVNARVSWALGVPDPGPAIRELEAAGVVLEREDAEPGMSYLQVSELPRFRVSEESRELAQRLITANETRPAA